MRNGCMPVVLLLLATALTAGCSGGRNHYVAAESKMSTTADRAKYFYKNAKVHEERGDLARAATNFCLAYELGYAQARGQLERLNASCTQGVATIAARPAPPSQPTPTPTQPAPSAIPQTIPAPPKKSVEPAIVKPSLRMIGTGSGFAVSKNAVVTNEHVIDGCRAVTITRGVEKYAAIAVKYDRRVDLAVLFTEDAVSPVLALRDSNAELGEDIVAFGFPYSQYLSSTPKLSVGVISATAGIRDNTSEYQISAPIQPGNSGGPVVGTDGTVVGVSVAMLDSDIVHEQTGTMPQNVNFAVKGSVLRIFLDAHGVEFSAVSAKPSMDRRKMAKNVTRALFAIQCWADSADS